MRRKKAIKQSRWNPILSDIHTCKRQDVQGAISRAAQLGGAGQAGVPRHCACPIAHTLYICLLRGLRPLLSYRGLVFWGIFRVHCFPKFFALQYSYLLPFFSRSTVLVHRTTLWADNFPVIIFIINERMVIVHFLTTKQTGYSGKESNIKVS